MPAIESSNYCSGSSNRTIIGGLRVRSSDNERCYVVPSGVSMVTPDFMRLGNEVSVREFIDIVRRSTQVMLPFIFPIHAERRDRTMTIRTYGQEATGLLRVFWALHGKDAHVVPTRATDQVTMNGYAASRGFHILGSERVMFQML